MRYFFCFFLLLLSFTLYGQESTKNYILFDQISLFDVRVGTDSTYVIEYEYDEYMLEKRCHSYLSLKEFKKDQYIYEDEEFINTDSLSNTFELQKGDTFSFNSRPDIVLEVIPNNMLASHYEFDTIVPDAINGCSLRFKQIKTENFSVYLVLDCDKASTTSLLFQNNQGQLYADAEELLWELDLPRVQKVFSKEISPDFPNRLTCFAGGLEVFEVENSKGIKDLITNTIFLPAEYDEIELRDIIIVKRDNQYGAFDYKLNTILDLGHKIIETSWNNRFNTVFINADNQIGIVNLQGNKFYKDQLIKDRDFKKKDDYKIELIDSVFYLRKLTEKNLKNQYIAEVGTTPSYTNVFFDSKSADFYFDIPNFLFAKRKDGGYDFFSFIEYHDTVKAQLYNLNEKAEGYFNRKIQDYKSIKKYPFWSRYTARPILKINNREHPMHDDEISKDRYQSIDFYFDGYYRFTLPNGQKGWVDTKGNEFFDDE